MRVLEISPIFKTPYVHSHVWYFFHNQRARLVTMNFQLRFIAVALSLFSNASFAMQAGSYYYVISEQCKAVGLSDEQHTKLTPDVMLFEVTPAGISDYAVTMNTAALTDYTEQGQQLLSAWENEQVYTVGQAANPAHSYHDFLLQKETLSYTQLARTLNLFSQAQSARGHFFKQLLKIDADSARFKAVTRVRLFDEGYQNRLFLKQYVSEYFLLDENNKPRQPAVITVNHRAALTNDLHRPGQPWFSSTQQGACGERPSF